MDRLPFQKRTEALFRQALGDELFEFLEEQTKDIEKEESIWWKTDSTQE